MKKVIILLLFSFCLSAKAGWSWTGAVSSAWIEVQGNGTAEGPDLTGTNGFTISAWVFRTIDMGTTRAVLLAKGQTSPTVADSISYEFGIITNHFQFRYSPPGGGVVHTWQATTAAPNTNELTHVALRYICGTAGSIVLFVNGTNYSGSWIVGSGTVPGTNNNRTMWIGSQSSAANWVGFFNEIAIWTSVLSNQEVLNLYNSTSKRYPLMISSSTLVGYWPLDGWFEYRQQTSDQIPIAINMQQRPFHGSFEGFGSMAAVNERRFSYPPNE